MGRGIERFLGRLLDVGKRLFCDTATKLFIQNNRKRWKRIDAPLRGKILVERNSLQHCIISWSYFANYLGEVYDSKIYTYSDRGKINNYVLDSIYKSFGSQGNIQEILSLDQKQEAEKICDVLFEKCKTKQDWYNATILDYHVGIDIYESYLILGKPTINPTDLVFRNIVKEAAEKTVFWEKKLKELSVNAILISHDCYLGNIIRRVANRKKIPVYQITTGWGVELKEGFSFGDRYKCYRTLFRQLPLEKQKAGKQWAKKQLERRFSGEIGVDMFYSKKSSFGEVDPQKHILNDDGKIKVLICPHSFFDNPNCIGKRLFIDYYEWISYLGEISNLTDYDWYVKLHPDYRSGEIEVIQDIIKKYPKFKLIDENVSHKQLAYEGLNFALTVYGTIACEYPLLGVQVINAGNNPHIAYDFSWTPSSLEEYREWLLNLDQLHKDINPEEIYEFYCVHHIYGNYDSKMRGRDDLIFKSEKNMRETLGNEVYTSKMYRYFLDELDDERHEIIKDNVKQYFQQINDYDMNKLYIRE